MAFEPTVSIKDGRFGGGNYPEVPVTVRIVDFSLPEGHHLIGGQMYRMTYDPDELQRIEYPDGSRPTCCALVAV